MIKEVFVRIDAAEKFPCGIQILKHILLVGREAHVRNWSISVIILHRFEMLVEAGKFLDYLIYMPGLFWWKIAKGVGCSFKIFNDRLFRLSVPTRRACLFGRSLNAHSLARLDDLCFSVDAWQR